jgi:arylsulfatase A-like enzyme
MAALSAAALGSGPPDAPARHVVVVVFDGMRPDFISAGNSPCLFRLSREGVSFARHHPVYVSSTEVNGTALATGMYPSRGYVVANVEFRPAIDGQKPVAMEVPANVRRGDAVSGGRYLGAPTLAEILHRHGLATAIAGSKPIALLQDRGPRTGGGPESRVIYEGSVLPVSIEPEVGRLVGDFPPVSATADKTARDAWTTQALLRALWRDGVPAFSLLWLAEPDFSQHAAGLGTARALAAIRGSDANLGLVLRELEFRGLRGTTDILVVSDHGFSTIARKVDVAAEISTAGFLARRAALGGLRTGEVLVVGCGGSSLLYVGGHDRGVCRRLAAWLEVQDWTGVVFSRDPSEGAFRLAEAHIDSPEAPDLVVSLRWSPGAGAAGAPGLQTADLGSSSSYVASHASLSPSDMHATLVASGPDFRSGYSDPLPSGNMDLAPTVLWILGMRKEARAMDGRVLGEALTTGAPPLKSCVVRRLTARRETAGGFWLQYLQVSEVDGVRYLDQGNGTFTLNGP